MASTAGKVFEDIKTSLPRLGRQAAHIDTHELQTALQTRSGLAACSVVAVAVYWCAAAVGLLSLAAAATGSKWQEAISCKQWPL